MFILLEENNFNNIIYNYIILKSERNDLKLIDKTQYKEGEIYKDITNFNTLSNDDALIVLRHIDYFLYWLYVIKKNLKKGYSFEYEDLLKLFENKKNLPDYVTLESKDIYELSDNLLDFYKIHEFVTKKIYLNDRNNTFKDLDTLNFVMGSFLYFDEQIINKELEELKLKLKLKDDIKTYVVYKKNKPESSKTILAKKYFSEFEMVDIDEIINIGNIECNIIIVDDISSTGTSIVCLVDELFDTNPELKSLYNFYAVIAFVTSNVVEVFKKFNIKLINNNKILSFEEKKERMKFDFLNFDDISSLINYSSIYGKNISSCSSYSYFINYCLKESFDQIVVFDFDFTLYNFVNIRPYAKEFIKYLKDNYIKMCIFTYRYKEECDDIFYEVIKELFGENIKIFYREDCLDDQKNMAVVEQYFNIENILIIDDRDDLLTKGTINIKIPEYTEESEKDDAFLKIMNYIKINGFDKNYHNIKF